MGTVRTGFKPGSFKRAAIHDMHGSVGQGLGKVGLTMPPFAKVKFQVLGEGGVNVATFHLGRAEEGGDAIALIGTDQPIDDAVLTAVRALPHVGQAQALNF